MYLSLQYLSVADAIVLTFLTPITTAVAGSLLLKEGYSVTQAVAGGESYALNSLLSMDTQRCY
jgi:drug/metabolite transporter (DMT)-like permease